MRRQLLTTLVALAATTAVGCAPAPDPELGGASAEAPTRVEVTNHHPLLVTVEVVSSGRDLRLGQVETNATETFELPSTVDAGDVRILVDAMGSTETYLSPQVSAASNDLIAVTVEANLDLSTVAVR